LRLPRSYVRAGVARCATGLRLRGRAGARDRHHADRLRDRARDEHAVRRRRRELSLGS